MALHITVDSPFDPSLPVALPAAGAPGYLNRYISDALPAAAGTLVSTLPDLAGSLNLNAVNTGAGRPVIADAGTHKVLSFDGVNQGIRAGFSADGIKTVAMVVRPGAADTSTCKLFFGGGVNFLRSNTGAATMQRPGITTPPRTPNGSMLGGRFHIIIYTTGPTAAATTITLNGTAGDAAAGTPTGVLYQYGLGWETGAETGKFDLAELIGWPTVLSTADRAAVFAALRTRYADIL